jgi:hypothetical protein
LNSAGTTTVLLGQDAWGPRFNVRST